MLEALSHFKEVAGLAVHTGPEGHLVTGCLLRLQGQAVQITQKLEGTSLGNLRPQLPAGMPVALNLSGKGVLVKKLPATAEVTAANFSQVLPNADPEDFYLQQVLSGAQSYVALIRKTEAAQWFEELTALGYQPVALSLGPFPLLHILGDTNFYGESVTVNGHVITRGPDSAWLDYHYEAAARAEFRIKLQSEAMDERWLLPYAAAFQLLLHRRIDSINARAALFDGQLAAVTAVKRLKAAGVLLLLAFFLLLLANLLGFTWLAADNTRLAGRLNRTQQNVRELQVNTGKVKEKEELLRQLGWAGGQRRSVLISQLAAVLPPGIRLTGLSINPPDARATQQAKAPVFSDHLIRINGLSEQVLSVNEWLARLKTKPWVKSAVLDNYAFSNEQHTGVFTLTLTY